jgi:hypothetical protein
MGKHWRTFSGCEAWILDGHEQFVPAFGLQPTSAMALWNGPLPVTLRLYHL